MWWQGVDLVKTVSADRVPATKRTPQWPSQVENTAEQQEIRALRTNSAALRGNRPKSAAGSAQKQKHRNRPASAPSLLRGEGLPAWKTYEDPLRRGIESTQVKDTKDTLKRDRFLLRGVVDGIDVMADSSLFDLKVLHNSAQRARSAALGNRPGTAPPGLGPGSSARRRSRKGHGGDVAGQAPAKGGCHREDNHPSIAEVRQLCQTLNGDIAQHCTRMHMPLKCVQDKKLKHMVTKIQLMRGTLSMPQKDDLPAAGQEDEKAHFHKELKALFGNKKEEPKMSLIGGPLLPRTDDILEKLANFLLCASGSVRPSLEAIDSDGNGKFKRPDWAVGLELLGWNGDAEGAWRLLDFNNRGELTLKDIEERLEPHLPPPPDEE